MVEMSVPVSSLPLQPSPINLAADSRSRYESNLIERAQCNDMAAFNELVLIYQDVVYRQAYWLLNDDQAAEDATQEAFLRAYRAIHTFKGGPVRPWLLRIATNYCLDQIRHHKLHPTSSLEPVDENDEEVENSYWLRDGSPSVEEQLEQREEQARIHNAIRRLAPIYRSALVLVDLQGLDYSEAAAALGVPVGTFKSRLSRARVQLQQVLRPEHPGRLSWAA